MAVSTESQAERDYPGETRFPVSYADRTNTRDDTRGDHYEGRFSIQKAGSLKGCVTRAIEFLAQ